MIKTHARSTAGGFVGLILSGFWVCLPVAAGTLTATPTSLAVEAPGATATLTVSGKGDGATGGQVRVMRWLQQDGAEQLVATREVVASPPALKLAPGKDLTVRIVRVSKAPVIGEECYRILVDQLPGSDQDGLAVKFVLRHSIPLCFDGAKQTQGQVTWSIKRSGNLLTLTASNSGQRRVIAKDVKIKGAGGAAASFPSLTVLGGSSMSWPLRGALKGLAPGTSFSLTATINGQAPPFEGKVGGG